VLLLTPEMPAVLRLALILAAAIGAHIAVRFVRLSSTWFLGSRLGSIGKARTFTRFITSVAGFVIWFVAIGFALTELGVPLQTYLASATIIGLAVSFGSQSLVQDVISGLTLIFTGLIDVGDTVDIGGQTGIVEKIGIRYTELRSVQGAIVFIPNRNVANVITYPMGHIRALVDVRIREGTMQAAEGLIRQIAQSAFHQFSGVILLPPVVVRRGEEGDEPAENAALIRLKIRIWPGQGGVIEGAFRQRLIAAMRTIDPDFQDWMVTVHYRVERTFQRRAASALEMFRRRRRSG
jgi:moderate conductance mechanosensitive channel